jgi:hypothetical protein
MEYFWLAIIFCLAQLRDEPGVFLGFAARLLRRYLCSRNMRMYVRFSQESALRIVSLNRPAAILTTFTCDFLIKP